MSLTENDISKIRDVVIDAFESLSATRFDAIESDITEMKSDIVEMKSDIVEMKSDITGLKSDVVGLKADVRDIRSDMRELRQTVESIDGRLQAVENDIKDIYVMMSDLQKDKKASDKFLGKTLEDKIIITYKEVLKVAKEAGVKLPK